MVAEKYFYIHETEQKYSIDNETNLSADFVQETKTIILSHSTDVSEVGVTSNNDAIVAS